MSLSPKAVLATSNNQEKILWVKTPRSPSQDLRTSNRRYENDECSQLEFTVKYSNREDPHTFKITLKYWFAKIFPFCFAFCGNELTVQTDNSTIVSL